MMRTLYRWWCQGLHFLDLTSNDKPSFSKFVCLAILVAVIVMDKLDLGIVIALLAASFGRSVFLAFVNRDKPPQPSTGEPG